MEHVPLDLALIVFPGNKFKGEIVPELYSLVDREIIRIVDLVFISKNKDGGFTAIELNDLDEESYRQFIPIGNQLDPLFTSEDIENAAQAVAPDSSALFILWQNTWSETFRRAVKNADGQLVMHERVPAQVLDEVMQEVAAAQAAAQT
jgi:uncharacterized membrane protein